MRLWTLHPRYLDTQGLTALWRESLLARAVLRGETRGYKHHAQLLRFQLHLDPCRAIDTYLHGVHAESLARGYRFDPGKLGGTQTDLPIIATSGQLAHEWQHLLGKLQLRSPALFTQWNASDPPQPHPTFTIVSGGVEPWERT